MRCRCICTPFISLGVSLLFLIMAVQFSGVYFYFAPMSIQYDTTSDKTATLYIYFSNNSKYDTEYMNCTQYETSYYNYKGASIPYTHLCCTFDADSHATIKIGDTILPIFVSRISWTNLGSNNNIALKMIPYQLGTYYTQINMEITKWTYFGSVTDDDYHYYFNIQTLNDPLLPPKTTVMYFTVDTIQQINQHTDSIMITPLAIAFATAQIALIVLVVVMVFLCYKKCKEYDEDADRYSFLLNTDQ